MVFSIEHLHRLRADEVLSVTKQMPQGAAVLEIGAGTGFQSKLLNEQGFCVVAVDLPESSYASQRVFPVADYDGRTLPVPSNSIDVVFSSNVLEHVVDLPTLQSEIRRVLKPNGFCLHIMPSPWWRLWTIVSGWFDLVPAIVHWLTERRATTLLVDRYGSNSLMRLAKTIGGRVIPIRHGEHGTGLSEFWTFSRESWCRQFAAEGFEVEFARPMGLFYTGFMLFGRRLSTERRRAMALWLGSACNLYKVRPTAAAFRSFGASSADNGARVH